MNSDNLNFPDPRILAAEKYGSGIVMVAATIKNNNNFLSFGIPSMAALFLNLSEKSFKLSTKSLEKSQINLTHNWSHAGRDEEPNNYLNFYDFFEHKIANIIFSFSAIEAFTNMNIPEDIKYKTEKKGKAVIYNQLQCERNLSLNEKLNKILPVKFGIKSLKDIDAWKKFVILKNIRNRIIHPKRKDINSSGPEDDSIWRTLFENKEINFTENATAIIGYFLLNQQGHGWFKRFPYDEIYE